MRLRTKIFLFIGGLFLVSFLLAQILDEVVSSKLVKHNERIIEKKIKERNAQRRSSIQTYMHMRLQYEQATIKAIIHRIEGIKYWQKAFSPTDFNLKTNTWLSAAELLVNNKRLDLIENINNQKLSSLIILDQPPPYHILALPLTGDVKLCIVDPQLPGMSLEGPFIGIPFMYNELIYTKTSQLSAGMLPPDPDQIFYLLYDPQFIEQFDENALAKKIKEFHVKAFDEHMTDVQLDFSQLTALSTAINRAFEYMKQAQRYLRANPQVTKDLIEKSGEWFHRKFENYYDITHGYNDAYDIDRIMADRFDQIEMIWQVLAFNATGLYHYDPFDRSAPRGIGHAGSKNHIGRAILTKSVFFSHPVDRLTNQVYKGDHGRIFIGESVGFSSKDEGGINQGRLTLGVDIRNILEGITLVSNQYALMLVNGKVVQAYDNQGLAFKYIEGTFPLSAISKQPTGIFKDRSGEAFYYETINLLGTNEVQLILYNTRDKEYALLDIATESARHLGNQLAMQTSIIAFMTLIVVIIVVHFLSKKITTPISILADTSRKVQEGQLERIDLPEKISNSKDEIAELYYSFREMITGLQEKEKVKGVLNKVVSPQIANKILDGQVELGGEEKVVTVLFADIRHFTQITEQIPPSELISILNLYMTVLSKTIDHYEGVIDKYVGDQVMALFGAPLSSIESAHHAVECAIQMIHTIQELNEERMQHQQLTFEIGIGIHTGIVVAGNMGAENRMNYTVLGANVNLASRLCSIAEGNQILVSKETLESYHVKDYISYKEIEEISLKGFSTPISVFEVFPKEER